jgi:hypothetical protein
VFSAGKESKVVDGGKDYQKFGFFLGQFNKVSAVSHVIKTAMAWFPGHAATKRTGNNYFFFVYLFFRRGLTT